MRRKPRQGDYDYTGPDYPDLGAKVAKFRKIPKAELTPEQKATYSAAIVEAILAKQRSELQRELPSFKPHCASGTWHTRGVDIHNAILEQRRRALLACPDQIRRKRTPAEWQAMYDAAMAEKCEAESNRRSPPDGASRSDCEVVNFCATSIFNFTTVITI